MALKYRYDLNAIELYSEIEYLKYQASLLMPTFQSTTQLDILKYIHWYSIQDLYPILRIAPRIFLTLPVITASWERSFNKLKIIQNYLRSTISQNNLTCLAILSIEIVVQKL